MAEMEVREDGTEVEVDTGDRIVVTVPEPGVSGYEWVVDQVPDPVEVEASEPVGPETTAPGAEGRRRVVLRARRPGQGIVTLRLQRSWERQPIKQFEVKVSVR